MKFNFTVFTLSLLMILTMVPTAFAQSGHFTITSGPTDRARASGFAEKAGPIRFRLSSGTASATSTLDINYGAPITNIGTGGVRFEVITADAYELKGIIGEALLDHVYVVVDGVCFNDTATQALTAELSSSRRNRLRLTLPSTDVDSCSGAANALTGVITIRNVRLGIAGSGITSGSIMADLSTGGDALDYTLSHASTTVIRSVVDAIDTEDGVTADDIPEIRPRTGTTDTSGRVSADFTVNIEENTVDAFGDGSDALFLKLMFDGIPDGLEIMDLAVSVARKDADPVESPGVISGRGMAMVPDGEPSLVEVTFMGLGTEDIDPDTDGDQFEPADLDTDEIDIVTVTGKIGFPDNASEADKEALLPLAAGEITVEVTLGPLGAATRPASIPRFAADWTDTLRVITIGTSPDGTTLTITYALSDGTFDTGMGLSNLSTDADFTATAIEFTFWMNGNKYEYMTMAGSPGNGLASNGTLSGGHTYAVLLSDLLEAANAPRNFIGHVIIEADANIGATVYISDWVAFAATGVVLGHN